MWTSTDPAGEFFNPYAYTTNPTVFIDPTGEDFDLDVPYLINFNYDVGGGFGHTGIAFQRQLFSRVSNEWVGEKLFDAAMDYRKIEIFWPK